MILKFDMPMRALQENRTIHMYLPDDYLTSGLSYPVLYMFDGHNLFYDEDATFGRSWRLEEEIAKYGQELIIVGQECSHEGNERLDEYGPYPFYDPYFGTFPGKGRLTMAFFVHELKPYIDAHFPTRPERESTWIGGSSCGGLMALYAGIQYSEIYSRAVCLSPYILPCISSLMGDAANAEIMLNTGFYISWGANEGNGAHAFIPETEAVTDLANLLMDAGGEVRFHCSGYGEHTEEAWQLEAHLFLRFLFETWTVQ